MLRARFVISDTVRPSIASISSPRNFFDGAAPKKSLSLFSAEIAALSVRSDGIMLAWRSCSALAAAFALLIQGCCNRLFISISFAEFRASMRVCFSSVKLFDVLTNYFF